MTITNNQIVLAESQVMADTDDGGGRMSGNVVTEGEINNTMPDISRLDRVYGRVNLRKLFMSVRAANQDTLLGAHTILLRKPIDPRVGVTLFKTGSHTDRRTEARDRIESYVVKATEAPFWLWGDQLQGQRTISCLQRLDQLPPESGEVYCLSGGSEQYFRITGVEVGRQTFVTLVGNNYQKFELQTLQVSMANELQSDYAGSDPKPTGADVGADKVLSTQVADAARYYGAQKLSASASPGDLTAKVESVYNNLVPSAQSETALTDRAAGPGQQPVIPASSIEVTVSADNAGEDRNGYAIYYTGRAIVPGSLVLAGGNGVYSDVGGRLKHTSGGDRINESSVDYQNGVVRVLYASSNYRNTAITLSFTPGAVVNQQSYSASGEVSLANRSLTYVEQLLPVPAPGTLIVEYRALGRWAVLRDNGAGILTGDGTGKINYSTGTIEMTLSALPDVGTEIIFSWGDSGSADIQIAAAEPAVSEMRLELSDGKPVTPGAVTISWGIDGSVYTLTDDGAGNLSGDGAGTVNYGEGVASIRPVPAPKQADGDFSVAVTVWDSSNGSRQMQNETPINDTQNITLANAPVKPGTIVIKTKMLRGTKPLFAVIRDDGNGDLKRYSEGVNGITVGQVNYATGVVTLDARTAYDGYQVSASTGGG